MITLSPPPVCVIFPTIHMVTINNPVRECCSSFDTHTQPVAWPSVSTAVYVVVFGRVSFCTEVKVGLTSALVGWAAGVGYSR